MAEPSPLRSLIADFLVFGRSRSAAALSLILAGAVLEGAGVVMLVPIVSLILGVGVGAGADESGGGTTAAVFDALGLETLGGQIGFVLAVFAVLLVIRFVVLLYRDDMLVQLQQDFVRDLRARAFSKLAGLPWAEVSAMRHGPIGHALVRDVDRSGQGVFVLVNSGIGAVMLAVQGALALALAPLVTLIVGGLGALLFFAMRGLRERAEHRGERLTAEDYGLFQSVDTFLGGLKPAKAHGLERDYVAAFERAARRVGEQYRAVNWDFALGRMILQSAAGGIAILAVLLGLFVIGGEPEHLIVTLIILARLYGPLQALQNGLQSLRHAAPSYVAARALAGPAVAGADTAWSIGVEPPAEPLDAPPGIELRAVSWKPPARAEAEGEARDGRPPLERVSARIPAGRITALLGESGAGKSTLCDLVVGLLQPSEGEVRLDGRPLHADAARRLRASVAYVGQEPFLFEDSLRQNLCWGCGPVSEVELWQALETVGADGLARGLEGGLDGRIRRDGARFSGGERQRLRLARALLRRPRLLVLDEATNALDLAAESRVLRAFFAARSGATVLMVSHRPGNLMLADHVILLEAGCLAETGAVAELAADPSSRTAALLGQGGPVRSVAADRQEN